MKSIKLILSTSVVAASLLLTSCGGDDDSPAPIPVENTPQLCSDGVDNDGDGNVDCDDTDCQVFTLCVAETCNDGQQNNGETGVDCGGPNCDACEVELSGAIDSDMTLDENVVYILDGFVRVENGATVTIPPGTILKAKTGDGADASAFIVTRGSKIDAVGTPDKPIIFTSVDDNIQPGETASTLDVASDAGKWGGLVILGNANVSVKPDNATDGIGKEGSIEGIPSAFAFSLYGGDDDSDDSGDLKYVSIRFTGTQLAENQEIQGLTVGGVGSGTTIENIEIIASKDDGVEFFGGTVDVTNLLIAYQEDDGIDIDQTYSGTVDNALVLLYNPTPGNDGFEIDGPEASGVNDGGEFTIKNTTVIQKGGARAARVKSSAQGKIMDSAFKDFAAGQPFLDGGANSVTIEDSQFNLAEADAVDNTNGGLTLTNVEYGVSNFTKGADLSQFDWTYAKELNLY